MNSKYHCLMFLVCMSISFTRCSKKDEKATEESTPISLPPQSVGGQSPKIQSQQFNELEAENYIKSLGTEVITEHHKLAITTFHQAEFACLSGDYAKCKNLLDSLWEKYPYGDNIWSTLNPKIGNSNTGTPPFYYALRILDEIANWHTKSEKTVFETREIKFSIVLVESSKGIMPRNQNELDTETGVETVNTLHPYLLSNDYAMIRESLNLFIEYIYTLTNGYIQIVPNFIYMNDLTVPVKASNSGVRFAGLGNNAFKEIFNSLEFPQISQSDWWWVIYPSHVPNRYPGFVDTEFVSGGMGNGPNANSPLLISDDLWLVRTPPHLGKGDLSSFERRAYLPQWLQHEFFHHFFRTYPEFKLEESSHQWFNKDKWPEDFVGVYEADYFHEAIKKRFSGHSNPQFWSKLRTAFPQNFESITLDSICGKYKTASPQNDWHYGQIQEDSSGTIRWTNNANASWSLTPDLVNGKLDTGEENPYKTNHSETYFALLFSKDEFGDYTKSYSGFSFGSNLFIKDSSLPCTQ